MFHGVDVNAAKVFWLGRSQTVRLPKAFRFKADKVRVRRHGRPVILEPVACDWDWLEALTEPVDEDFASAVADKPEEQRRPALDFFELRYLLDSNAVIGLLAGKASLNKRIRRHAPQDFGVSAIAVRELFFDAFRSQRTAPNLGCVEGLQFEIVGFDQDDSRQAGATRATLAAPACPACGSRIGRTDPRLTPSGELPTLLETRQENVPK